MGSIADDRRHEMLRVWKLWRYLPKAQRDHDWSDDELRTNETATLERLAQLCAPEILQAVSEDLKGAGLCGIYVLTAGGQEAIGAVDHLSIIYAGVRRAADTVTASGEPLHEHLKACVAASIGEETSHRVASLNGLKARDLLSALASTTSLGAALLIDHLENKQRNALSKLLYRELGDKPRLLAMDRAPTMPPNPTLQQRYKWLHWYLWCLEMHKPERQRVVGGVPQIIVVADGDRMLTNRKTGQPVDPLAAIHAPVWRVLGRELNKKGHPIKDPESESKIASSAGMSRDKLRSLPKLPVNITLDGEGRVVYEYTGDDLLKAIEASLRKKPGNPTDP